MIAAKRVIACVLLVAATGFTQGARAQLPAHAEALLIDREQNLSHNTFAWQRTEHYVWHNMPKFTYHPDPHDKYKIVSVPAGESSGKQDYGSQWTFICDGAKTLVSGSTLSGPPDNINSGGEQYYEAQVGLAADTYEKKKDGAEMSCVMPVIWQCSGDCVHYISPEHGSLNLQPTDFAIFAGKSPLAMYGASWQTTSSSPEQVSLATTVRKGTTLPYTVKITLDVKRGFLPVEINNTCAYWKEKYVVQRAIPVGDQWMPSQVDQQVDIGDHEHFDRSWTLLSTTPSSPIHYTIPHTNQPVLDTRQLGANLTIERMLMAMRNKDPYLVQYRWPGHIPDKAEVEDLLNRNGFSTKPNRLDWIFWIPAVLLIVSGRLWLWKLKRAETTAQLR